jgi:hypothetical protein
VLQVKNFSSGHHILRNSSTSYTKWIILYEPLLYELVIEHVLRILQRVLDFVT